MRRLILTAAATLSVACASAGAPPGGPEDRIPPQIVKISPDSGETNVKVRAVEFQFDETVNDRPSAAAKDISQLFLISPRNGDVRASWRRSRIAVRPERGFRDNTAYTITLLPGLADLRGNIRNQATTVVFSTGQSIPPFSIPGRVFDWASERPAPGAYVEALLSSDTSVAYLAMADTTGQFNVGPLPAGTYIVRAVLDANKNRAIDRGEKWDSTTVTLAETRPFVELDAIERDSVPPVIDNVTVIDSVSVRVSFDKPLNPAMPLQPALVDITAADSSHLEIARVEWAAAFDRARVARDSARRADSLRAATPTPPVPAPGVPPATTQPPAPPAMPGVRPAPAPPKPSQPPPQRAIVVSLAPKNPLVPGGSYRITTRGFRNLLGRAWENYPEKERRDAARPFTVAKPAPPPKPPADTTKRPPTDTTRRPPPR